MSLFGPSQAKGKGHAIDMHELMEDTPCAHALVAELAVVRLLYQKEQYGRLPPSPGLRVNSMTPFAPFS